MLPESVMVLALVLIWAEIEEPLVTPTVTGRLSVPLARRSSTDDVPVKLIAPPPRFSSPLAITVALPISTPPRFVLVAAVCCRTSSTAPELARSQPEPLIRPVST